MVIKLFIEFHSQPSVLLLYMILGVGFSIKCAFPLILSSATYESLDVYALCGPVYKMRIIFFLVIFKHIFSCSQTDF